MSEFEVERETPSEQTELRKLSNRMGRLELRFAELRVYLTQSLPPPPTRLQRAKQNGITAAIIGAVIAISEVVQLIAERMR